MSERHAVECALFAEALHRSGRQQFVAGGLSMLPAIWPGDRLTIESTEASDLRAGEIVAWQRGDAIVVHRVVEVVWAGSGAHVMTRGDAMPATDDPVPASAILGRVIGVRRGALDLPASGSTSRPWRVSAALLGWWFAARQLVAIRCPATP